MSLFLPAVFVLLAFVVSVNAEESSTFTIANRDSLTTDELTYERIPLGEADDYKPCIARLPSGELLLTAFHQHKRDGNKVLEQSLLRLHDKRLLLTFTVRDLKPTLGVRVISGSETDDGFEVNFAHDRQMLDTRTLVGKDQGDGFGPTVQLKDGVLVTSCSYRSEDGKTHLEVVRWRLP